jgi:hypothetical protein
MLLGPPLVCRERVALNFWQGLCVVAAPNSIQAAVAAKGLQAFNLRALAVYYWLMTPKLVHRPQLVAR